MWHFLKANREYAKEDIAKEDIKILLRHLRILYYCPTEQDFKEKLSDFYETWKNYSAYLEYFKRYWIKTITPLVWASYSRKCGADSGDNMLEAWHFKVKSGAINLQYNLLLDQLQFKRPVNDFVRYLKKEFNYWLSIIENSFQRESWKKKQQHRRKQLETSRIHSQDGIIIEELSNEDEILFTNLHLTSNSAEISLALKDTAPIDTTQQMQEDSEDEGKIQAIVIA